MKVDKVAFKSWTQSLLSLPHVINSKYKHIYIQHQVFLERHVRIANIQNIFDQENSLDNGELRRMHLKVRLAAMKRNCGLQNNAVTMPTATVLYQI
jgi:hypothetical protein